MCGILERKIQKYTPYHLQSISPYQMTHNLYLKWKLEYVNKLINTVHYGKINWKEEIEKLHILLFFHFISAGRENIEINIQIKKCYNDAWLYAIRCIKMKKSNYVLVTINPVYLYFLRNQLLETQLTKLSDCRLLDLRVVQMENRNFYIALSRICSCFIHILYIYLVCYSYL